MIKWFFPITEFNAMKISNVEKKITKFAGENSYRDFHFWWDSAKRANTSDYLQIL